MVSRFRIQGAGFRDEGYRPHLAEELVPGLLRVQGAGCGVQGAGFRVQGSMCRVEGAGFRVQGSGFRIQGAGFRVEGYLSNLEKELVPNLSRERFLH